MRTLALCALFAWTLGMLPACSSTTKNPAAKGGGGSGGKAGAGGTGGSVGGTGGGVGGAAGGGGGINPCGEAPGPPQTGGATYYVAQDGSDSDPETTEQPFATIQHAADLVNPGDTVVVGDGTYAGSAGQAIVSINRGGKPDNYVWFRSANRWGAKLDGQHVSSFGFATTVGYVRIQGFEITNIGTSELAGGVACDSTDMPNCEVVSNWIHDIGQVCSDSTNTFFGVYAHQQSVLVAGNLIHHVGRYAGGESECNPTTEEWKARDSGILLVQPNGTPTLARIFNNVIYDTPRGWSVSIGGTVDDVKVFNNTFAGSNPNSEGHVSIRDGNDTNLFVKNNISYNPNAAFMRAGATATFSTTQVSHNMTNAGEVMSSTPTGVTIADNMVGIEPQFVNAGTPDFHLQSTSMAVDAGESLADVMLDFDGCPRPAGSAYDLGAFER